MLAIDFNSYFIFEVFFYIYVCGVAAAGFLYPSMLLLFLEVCMLASHLHM